MKSDFTPLFFITSLSFWLTRVCLLEFRTFICSDGIVNEKAYAFTAHREPAVTYVCE